MNHRLFDDTGRPLPAPIDDLRRFVAESPDQEPLGSEAEPFRRVARWAIARLDESEQIRRRSEIEIGAERASIASREKAFEPLVAALSAALQMLGGDPSKLAVAALPAALIEALRLHLSTRAFASSAPTTHGIGNAVAVALDVYIGPPRAVSLGESANRDAVLRNAVRDLVEHVALASRRASGFAAGRQLAEQALPLVESLWREVPLARRPIVAADKIALLAMIDGKPLPAIETDERVALERVVSKLRAQATALRAALVDARLGGQLGTVRAAVANEFPEVSETGLEDAATDPDDAPDSVPYDD